LFKITTLFSYYKNYFKLTISSLRSLIEKIINIMLTILSKLYNSTPAEFVEFLKKKISKKRDWNFSNEWVIQNPKYRSFNSQMDRWERYKRVLNCNLNYNNEFDLSFKDKVVCEIGCGPLLGIAPLAIFQGAKNYFYSEPFLNIDTLRSKEVKELILKNLHSELSLNYGEVINFDDFYEQLVEKCKPIESSDCRIDFLYSNSVLEHISKEKMIDLLTYTFDRLNTNSVYFHSVDFGHHMKGSKDLHRLYGNNRFKKLPTLNMMRKSEIYKILTSIGFSKNLSFTYKSQNLDRLKIDNSWKKYKDDDLKSRVVFFIGSK